MNAKKYSGVTKILVVVCMLSIGIFFLLYSWKINIAYTDVKDYISMLQNTSAMIFAIVGLWVSSTYPTTKQALTESNVKVKHAEFGEQSKRLETLIGVLITSALIMVCLLVFQGAKMIIPNFDFYSTYNLVIKSSAIAILFGLGVCQVIATVYIIVINVTFINEIFKIIHDNDKNNQY
ncbi:hypothetical protein TUMSATVNIG1_07710 [Vibrio nigripulchritudo]|uniref:hypothetical protein n=1 Tax=Vibrio nigripulchritudo TaxID=28173 RepID=UPI00190B2DEB|nr:hypothetical protein [Vibrio nigripulchritudo]BCL68831.1 hypothetical protein VNTUMSATTG_07680 [Vibrio nigripulchritudo]BDU30162.1 hypothetical protein TUMSATVNIG1_07710 [Vibrio nigripulchritudo]